jgi:hypothetical protein
MRAIKALFSGIVGASILFLLCTLIFSLIKIIYLVANKDLLISRGNIALVTVILVLIGFIYGIRSYLKGNTYTKSLALNWNNFLLDFIISAIIAFIVFIILKYIYRAALPLYALLLFFIIGIILFYPFSGFVSFLLLKQKAQHRVRNKYWAFILNPVFVVIYLWLFGMILYNAVYVPCAVTILGVDKNPFTANTINLGIPYGSRLVSIDNNPIVSINEVKSYLSSMESTKEVSIETEDQIYHLKTYMVEDKRLTGLLLKQEYCARE